MKPFLDDSFLLESGLSQKLYFDNAAELPIIDFHNHLPVEEIANKRQFENLTQLWLEGDHYKWRAMRTLGVNEKYITGGATDKEKFLKWAETVPSTLRNPLYHWTHLELKRYFSIDRLLDASTAESIYEETREKLKSTQFSAEGLLNQMNVETICTTDDPADTLAYHEKIKDDGLNIKVLPTFRPDKFLDVSDPNVFNANLRRLELVVEEEIPTFQQLLEAMKKRIEFFHQMGCRLSDHGFSNLDNLQPHVPDAKHLFEKIKKGEMLTGKEKSNYRTTLLLELSKMYHDQGWVQQIHLGALRNTNRRMFEKIGPDAGFDSIGDFPQSEALSSFFDRLDSTNQLTKTIIYNLNPALNEVFATMIGNYNDGSVKGKMQFGSGWWFLDQLDGMEKQMNALSNMGLLSCFVGMVTDSRSFLSFPRHEYFRRLLCRILGDDMEKGLLPSDEKMIGRMVQDICYYNAKSYFNFEN